MLGLAVLSLNAGAYFYRKKAVVMVKKLLLCVVLVMFFVSSAFGGEARIWHSYGELASLIDGKPDYSNARFSALYFVVIHDDAPMTKENTRLSGTIKLSGGNYSFWNGREIQKVSGTPQTFRLGLETGVDIRDYETPYQLFTDVNGDFRCAVEAENGMNGITASWTFPEAPEINGTYIFPDFMTTQEQLNKCIPYFEFIRSGSDVIGINWRIVRASDTLTPVSQDFALRLNYFEMWDSNYNQIYSGRPKARVEAGEIPEGVFMFDESVNASDITRVRIRMDVYKSDIDENYTWNFYAPAQKSMLYMWSRHASDALLVDGKSNYNSAKFANVFFELEDNYPVICEAKYFTEAGRINVSGGDYTLKDADTGDTIGTVTDDATFKLRFDAEGAIGDEYLEYWPVDDNGRFVAFAGGAETGLNGKTITWTFPAELAELNGSGTIPKYKSTAEQLASGVPYVEVISEDGYITALKYRIVTASDTSTAITPSYRTNFRFCFDRAEGKDVWANTYLSAWQRNTASGTYTLDIPQPLSIVKRVRVWFRSYEDSDNPAVYQWNFYPSSGSTLPEGTIQPTQQLSSEVLNNIVDSVEGITTSEDIHYITSENTGRIADPTDEMTQAVKDDNYEIIGVFNSLSVDVSGWYVVKVTLSEELFEVLKGKRVSDLKIYSLTDSAAHSSGTNASIINGLLNTWEILSLNGEKLDTFGVREFLMVGFLDAGTPFSMYIAKILLAILAGGCNTCLTLSGFILASLVLLKKR